ncbi:MAG: hypothetical protein ACR2IS_04545 [Nitrososphaeraceae archaeon]
MSKPNWACSICGMYSGRRESVQRHIDNPNIHIGNGTVISFSDSLIRRQAGFYVSNPATTREYRGREHPFFPNTSKKMFNMFEKALSQKMAEEMAKKTINAAFEPHSEPSSNNIVMSTENWLICFFKNTQDLFGIDGRICLRCLTIEPVKLSYTEAENIGGYSGRLRLPCLPLSEYVSGPTIRQYRRYIKQNGFPSQLKIWLDFMLPNTKQKKIEAIRVPEARPGNATFAVRLAASKSISDPIKKKYVSLQYSNEKCYDLLLPTDTNPNHWSIRAIEDGLTTLMDEDEIIDYLSITKHSTYGFFRTKTENPNPHSPRIRGGCLYLIMLVFGNETHTIDNVYYD